MRHQYPICKPNPRAMILVPSFDNAFYCGVLSMAQLSGFMYLKSPKSRIYYDVYNDLMLFSSPLHFNISYEARIYLEHLSKALVDHKNHKILLKRVSKSIYS